MILGGTSYSESPFSGAEFSSVNNFVYPTSLGALSSLGSLTPDIVKSLSGFLANAELGDVTTLPVFVTGFDITSTLSGIEKVQLAKELVGLAATSNLGIVRPTRSFTPTGVSASGQVGSITPKVRPVFVGVQGQGQVGSILFVASWNAIPTDEQANWNVFTTDDNGNWVVIGNFQNDTWNEIDT